MTPGLYKVLLLLVAAAATVRSIGILLLKGRQLRYRARAAAKPTSWADLSTEPEPPLLGLVTLTLLWRLDVPASVSAARAISAVLAVVAAALGWAVILWAVRSFPGVSPGHYILPEQKIISSGAYGCMRHPLYLGALFIWLALALAFWSRAALVATVFYVVPAYWIYMRAEERMLLSHFGEPYARYRERVGMLFPRCRFPRRI